MKKIIAFLLITLIFSCKEEKKEATTDSTSESKEMEKPALKLYAFDGGTVQVNNLELFSQDTTYQGQTKELSLIHISEPTRPY